MKTIKFQVDETLWERFYRAFPGHGERSTVLRKIVRYIVINKAQHKPFSQVVGEAILEDLEEDGESS